MTSTDRMRRGRWVEAGAVAVVIGVLAVSAVVERPGFGPWIAAGAVAVIGMLAWRASRVSSARAGRGLAGVAVLAFAVWTSPEAVIVAVGAGALVYTGFGWRGRRRRVGVVVAVVMVGAGALWWAGQAAAERAEQAARHAGAGDYARAQLLPGTPARLVADVMRLVADDDPTACWLFTGAAAEQFARANAVLDCPAAVHAAHEVINDPASFGDRVDLASLPSSGRLADGVVLVDGCGVRWRENAFTPRPTGSTRAGSTPGPPPGRFTVAPVNGGVGWVATMYTPC